MTPKGAVVATVYVRRSFDGIEFDKLPQQMHPDRVRDWITAEKTEPGRVVSCSVVYHDERGRRL